MQPSPNRVTVTDPAHPFYGLTFPCRGLTTIRRLGRACAIELAPGIERFVPVAATDLAGPSPPPSPCRLSVAAVQALLAVLASVASAPLALAHEEATDAAIPPHAAWYPAAAAGAAAAADLDARVSAGGVGQPHTGGACAGRSDPPARRPRGGA